MLKPAAGAATRRTTAIASFAIATLACHHAVAAGDGDPARTAFGNAVSFTMPAGHATVMVPLAQVPTGKRYVIELVTLSCTVPLGSSVSAAVLQVGQNPPNGANSPSTQLFSIPLQSQGGDPNGNSVFVGTLAARMYADDITGTPSDLSVSVTQVAAFLGPLNCRVAFSGYLLSL